MTRLDVLEAMEMVIVCRTSSRICRSNPIGGAFDELFGEEDILLSKCWRVLDWGISSNWF